MTKKNIHSVNLTLHKELNILSSPALALKNVHANISKNIKQRILVISHAHPDFSLGGGELAAYNLFKEYQKNLNIENAWFLARADRGRGPTGQISLRRKNEYLWEQSVNDWHRMKAVHQESVFTWFADLIRALKPSVVHTHHYAHLGLEYLRVIKQVDPKIRIIMTLHEYMAICKNQGQMIKTKSFKLCSNSSPDDCAKCFPDNSPEDFWLRKHYFLSYFDFVDQFVSPSEFLRKRYIDWGIKDEKIAVIENGQVDEKALKPRVLPMNGLRNRFGYFGQITQYKGLDVILEALTIMNEKESEQIVLEVHGANLELQNEEFVTKVKQLSKPLIDRGIVQWIGPYHPDELRSRMASIDWVVVPSIWWENSPMVIQEAFSCGRPLIVSDIGGMKEKVTHNVDGMHVSNLQPKKWATALLEACASPDKWEKMSKMISKPLSITNCANMHLML
jgi:glycosyltransferase involved in cell wall biosynthesis